MEERVGIPHVCPGEPDDPCKDTGTRVRGKPDHEVADKVFGFCDVVERFEAVAFDEKVVDEQCNADHVLGAGVRDEDVLRVELEHLRFVLEIVPVRVLRVAQRAEMLDGDPDLVGPDMRERQVDHVKPRGPVLEDPDVPDRPQDAFFHRLDGLLFRDHPLDTFDEGDTVGLEPQACHDLCILPFHVKGHPLAAGGGSVTAGAAGKRCFPAALRAGEDGRRYAPRTSRTGRGSPSPRTGNSAAARPRSR